MQKNKKFMKTLVWLQLIFSIFLGATAIWGYLGYRSAIGPFTQSLAKAIISSADVISRTAETVQAKQSMVDNTLALLVSSRKLVEELRSSAQTQAALVPKYAEALRSASALFGTADNVFSTLGNSLTFSVPTSIAMQGLKPVLVMTQPLAPTGQSIKQNGAQLKSLGDALERISSSMTKDGQNLTTAFIDTSNQTIKLLDDTEKTLAALKGLEFPKALADLKIASDNLRAVGTQVDMAGNIGLVLLIAGLLLAGWCFLNSLHMLYLTNECFAPSPQCDS